MVMYQSSLDAMMTREEQIEIIRKIRDAKSGSQFEIGLEDGKFNVIQTLFFLAKEPYKVQIQGNTARWTKG